MSVIQEDIFDEVYEPIKNHLDEHAGWDGNLFETFGEELDFVRKVCQENPNRVWTLVDDDNGDMVIVAGMHLVNRLGYFITKKDWVTGEEIVPQEGVGEPDPVCDKCGESFYELIYHENSGKEVCDDCEIELNDEEE